MRRGRLLRAVVAAGCTHPWAGARADEASMLRKAAMKDTTRGPPGCIGRIPDQWNGDTVYTEATRRLLKWKHVSRFPAMLRRPPLFVEVGGHTGQSTCFLSRLLTGRSHHANKTDKYKNVTFHVVGLWYESELSHMTKGVRAVVEKYGRGHFQQAWSYFLRKTKTRDRVDKFLMSRHMTTHASKYAAESITFLYLDRRRKWKYTKKDLEKWWPKIRLGGWLCGTGYTHGKSKDVVKDFFPPSRSHKDPKVYGWGKEEFCVGKQTQATPTSASHTHHHHHHHHNASSGRHHHHHHHHNATKRAARQAAPTGPKPPT